MVSVEDYLDTKLVVLWAPGSDSRTHTCPVHVSADGSKDVERAYYIRRMSHTIRAGREEEAELIMASRRRSYDEYGNPDATLDDLDFNLIRDHLRRVGSSIPLDQPKERILESMRLLIGPPEAPVPVNAALMMFCNDPERFFDRAWIEIVEKPDPTGEGMTENVFRGPFDYQLGKALSFLRDVVIRERIFKVDGEAEAIRVNNYPYNAVEEVLVNAVYHRSYQPGDPVVVTVTPTSLEVLSFPGLDFRITDQDIRDLNIRSRGNRNRRLGDFLKELRLTEGRNTGIPKIIRAMEANGSPPPIYETDEERTYLNVILPVHPRFMPAEPRVEVRQQSTRRSCAEIGEEIVRLLGENGCTSAKELSAMMGYSGLNSTFRRAVSELMGSGEVVYLYPENPRDSRQKLCLAGKGRGPSGDGRKR